MMNAENRDAIKTALSLKAQFDGRSEMIKGYTNKTLAVIDQFRQAQSDFDKVVGWVSNFEEIVSKFRA